MNILNVALDALIKRDNFDSTSISESFSSKIGGVSLNNLKKGDPFFTLLRKPDFQRETNEWDPRQVCDLIKSFLDEGLIPAVILWQNSNNFIFVIDGSHRLSALIAWVNDDYGDGEISKAFYDDISKEQKETASKIRKLVQKEIKPYNYYQNIDYGLCDDEVTKKRFKSIASSTVQCQWVSGGASKAEESFFIINQKSVIINRTELLLCKSRNYPTSIATRAIYSNADGYKYWNSFNDQTQSEVVVLSKEIHSLLFEPTLATPIQTLDVPMAGKRNSSQCLSLVYNLVEICNKDEIESKKYEEGEKTIKYLKNTLSTLKIINSKESQSLGLHPIPYFYTFEGQFKPASFIATVALFKELLKNKSDLGKFLNVRSKYEDFIMNYDYIVQQIIRKNRSADKSIVHIKDFFKFLIKEMDEGATLEKILEDIRLSKKYSFIKTQNPNLDNEENNEFSREIKSKFFIRNELPKTPKCGICGGYMSQKSYTYDHIKRKQDGGKGSIDNIQYAHPYCNTTYKN